MDNDAWQSRLKALPVQLTRTNYGVVVKRGCTEVKISGEGALDCLQTILTATANGATTPRDICELVPPSSRPAVQQLIDLLVARRILVSEEEGTSVSDIESDLDIFYWHFNQREKTVADILNSHHFSILGVNSISRQLALMLVKSGIRHLTVVDDPLLRSLRLFRDDHTLPPEEWPSPLASPKTYDEWANSTALESLDCIVATSDFGACRALLEWNDFCLQHKRHFLPVFLHNLIGYIGPLVIPGETACFECFKARHNSHIDDPETKCILEETSHDGQMVVGFHPAMASILGDTAAFELVKFYSGISSISKVSTLIEVNLLLGRMETRRVLKIPRCPACSPLLTKSSVSPDKHIDVLKS